MGGIFLRRTRRPQAEVINDRGRDVYNLFRMLQEHYVAFLDLLRFQITTQANFNRLVAVDPDTLTDLQRAARFLYLQRCAFGGKVSGRNFGARADRPGRFNLTTLEPDLEALHSRLVRRHRDLPRLRRTSSAASTDPARCSTSTRPIGAARATTASTSSAASGSRKWPGRSGRLQGPLHPVFERPSRGAGIFAGFEMDRGQDDLYRRGQGGGGAGRTGDPGEVRMSGVTRGRHMASPHSLHFAGVQFRRSEWC